MNVFLAGLAAGVVCGIFGTFWLIGTLEEWPVDADDFGDALP